MRTKFLIFLFLLVQMGMAQEDRTAPKYDVTRPNGKTTAQINSMTRMVEGSEVWNTDTNSMWLYKNSAWADTTADPITVDTAITDGGANPVTGGTIFDALALKLDASAGSFVTTNTNQTITSNKTFSGTSTGLGVVVFDPTSRSIISGKQAFYVDVDGRLNWLQTGSAWGAKFDHLGLNGLRTYTYPDKDGTFAMLSDIPSGGGGGGGILTNGNQTGLLGNKTWEGIHTFGNTLGSQHNRLVNIYGTEAHLTISNSTSHETGYVSGAAKLFADADGDFAFNPSSGDTSDKWGFTFQSDNTERRTYTLPNKDGTLATLGDISGGGGGFANPATEDLNMSNFQLLNIAGITPNTGFINNIGAKTTPFATTFARTMDLQSANTLPDLILNNNGVDWHLSFNSSSNRTSYDIEYTINPEGEPSKGTDILNKDYADATYNAIPDFETNDQIRSRLINSVIANKFEYPTPTATVVVNNLAELQAQENAAAGTEVQLAAGLVIDISSSVVRLDFNNTVYLTSQDKNNQGSILLGELGSHIRVEGNDCMFYDFQYSGTWTHATRPIDPAPETVGIEIRGDNFTAYNLTASGFSYACLNFKNSLDSHVEECHLSDVRATGLGYCIVLNGESTVTAYKNEYHNYRHTIAKASDWSGQGYTDYKSYVGKGGVIASYAYDSHGEPDTGHPSGTNEYAGAYMNVIDCYFEQHDELCFVSRGYPRKEMVLSGNTFVRGNRAQTIRQTIQGVVVEPDEERNTFDLGDNLYLGAKEDPNILFDDYVYYIDDGGISKLNIKTKEKEKISSNRNADYVFSGDFVYAGEVLAINGRTVQVYTQSFGSRPVYSFTLSQDIKGVVPGRFFQNIKDELLVYTETSVIRVNFDSETLTEETLLSGLDIKFAVCGNFRNSGFEMDVIVVSNNDDHNIYENGGSALGAAVSLGNYPGFTSGYVMDYYDNGTDDITLYNGTSKQGYRTRFLAGVYREAPSIRFTITGNATEFFVKEVNGVDRLFNYGGGMLKSFLQGSSGFSGLTLLNIAYLGNVSKISK